MKKSQDVYLIFRKFTKKEQQQDPFMFQPRSSYFFGWTPSKAVAKAFMEQRDSSKYILHETDTDELEERRVFSDPLVENTMIDVLELRSNRTGEDVIFLTTAEEKMEIEEKIKKMFNELSLFDYIWKGSQPTSSITDLVNMVANLQSKYSEALFYIGYHPEEFNYVYDGPTEDDDYGIPSPFSTGYASMNRHDTNNPSKMIIFSLESVIKVLKDEL